MYSPVIRHARGDGAAPTHEAQADRTVMKALPIRAGPTTTRRCAELIDERSQALRSLLRIHLGRIPASRLARRRAALPLSARGVSPCRSCPARGAVVALPTFGLTALPQVRSPARR